MKKSEQDIISEAIETFMVEDEAWGDAHEQKYPQSSSAERSKLTKVLKNLSRKRSGGSTGPWAAEKILKLVNNHPHIDDSHLNIAVGADDEKVQLAALSHPKASEQTRLLALGSEYTNVTLAAANHPKTNPESLKKAILLHSKHRGDEYKDALTKSLHKKMSKE